MKQLDYWRARHPDVAWAAPIVLCVGERMTEWGCRICVAERGLDAKSILRHPVSEKEFHDHALGHRISERP